MDKNEETNQNVYISFNNNDLSISSFISYLVAALYREGIHVVSENTGHDLEKGWFSHIRLCVVVFSNPHKFSVAYLEKLVKLLEFLRKEGHVLVPVFNDANAKQIEIFAGAFAVLGKSYSADQVTKWHRVLKQTMELQGHEYTDKLREESEFIEEIAKNVFEKLYPTENIGIHTLLRELENLLCNQPWGFRSIGILGEPAGIGKTTFVKAAFRKMCDGYDASRFIIECNNTITEFFSDEDFQEIPMEEFDINNQDAKPCYRRKRVLLVLENLQNAQDAESFQRGFNRFGPGSLLIITSRYRKVLEECHLNEIYELKGLNYEDALKLFTRCVFGKDITKEKLRKRWVSEIERCHGNPSTIRSYAEKIKSRKTKYMESALDRICHDSFNYTKNIPHLCFQETLSTFSITLKQSLLFTDAHNYQSDLEKLSGFDLANHFEFRLSDLRALDLYHDLTQKEIFCTISSSYLSDFEDLSLLNPPSCALESMHIDLKILHLGQEYVLVCQLNKPWEGYKSFPIFRIIKLHHSKKLVEVKEISEARDTERIEHQDFTSMKRITVVTDQLEPLQLVNLSGCIESQILQWRLQTEPLCLLCNSANVNRSHFYFDCNFCRSIWTAISNRIHLSPLQIWEDVRSAMVNLKESKAKKILSRMAWYSTICGLLVERNSSRLYSQSYRSADAILVHIDRNFRISASFLRKRHPKIAFKFLQLWLQLTDAFHSGSESIARTDGLISSLASTSSSFHHP